MMNRRRARSKSKRTVALRYSSEAQTAIAPVAQPIIRYASRKPPLLRATVLHPPMQFPTFSLAFVGGHRVSFGATLSPTFDNQFVLKASLLQDNLVGNEWQLVSVMMRSVGNPQNILSLDYISEGKGYQPFDVSYRQYGSVQLATAGFTLPLLNQQDWLSFSSDRAFARIVTSGKPSSVDVDLYIEYRFRLRPANVDRRYQSVDDVADIKHGNPLPLERKCCPF